MIVAFSGVAVAVMTVESGAPSGVRQCGSPQVPPSVLRFCSAGLWGKGEGGRRTWDFGKRKKSGEWMIDT